MPFQKSNDGLFKKGNEGTFKKGWAGGPGRPPGSFHVVIAREYARAYTKEAIVALVEVCRQQADLKARVLAAEAILNRGWGKPVETHEVAIDKRPIRELTDAELTTIISEAQTPPPEEEAAMRYLTGSVEVEVV